MPRDDRAGGGLGPARHAHPGGPRRRRLGHHGNQALHQPRRRGRLRDPLRRDRGAAPGADAPRRAEITAFLVDIDTPGLTVLPGYRSVSHRGYGNSVLVFDGCRVPGSAVLGEVGSRLRRGHHLAGHDPPAGRGELPRPGAPRARPGRAPRGDPAPVRPDHRAQPGGGVQARRHEHGAGVRDVADLARGLAGRRPPLDRSGGRRRDRDGQARRDRDARERSPTRRCRSTAAWA